MKKLAIFDLDGTLLNTIHDLGNACNYALETMGFPSHPISAYNYMVGNGVRKLLERAQPDADAATLDTLLSHFRHYYDDNCTVETRPYPGIEELLDELQRRDVMIGVTSNKYQKACDKIIHHYFPQINPEAVFGQIDMRPVKPDPSIVFALLSKFPTPKSECIYMGDSAVDIETARRACIESVGVTWGFRPVSELRKACANHLVSNPSEILEFLDDPF